MKGEIANYIKTILESGNPPTDSQVKMIAYWEFADFQNKSEFLLKMQGLELSGRKTYDERDYDNEMFDLV